MRGPEKRAVPSGISCRDAWTSFGMFRGCRGAQSPANGFNPSGIHSAHDSPVASQATAQALVRCSGGAYRQYPPISANGRKWGDAAAIPEGSQPLAGG